MARRRTLEAKLARLAELADGADPDRLRPELEQGLGDKSAHVVAKAARVVRDLGLSDLVPAVETSVERFFVEPTSSDKGCIAKTAIVRCLAALESGSVDVFLRGLHHVQLEPAFGGRVDTAAELRGESAMGLAETGYPHAVHELTAALNDAEFPVRLAAVRALAATGRPEIEPLLHFKALADDSEPQVLSEVLETLLSISAPRFLPLLERYLDSGDEDSAQAAALALGASRCEGAFELLAARLGELDTPLSRTKLLAISMLRREEPIDFLMDLASNAPRRRAESVVTALAIHRHDPRIRDRLKEIVRKRADAKTMLAHFASELGRD